MVKSNLKQFEELQKEFPEEGDYLLKTANKQLLDLKNSEDPSNYVLLPESKDHPNILVPFNRLSYNIKLELTARKLKLDLKNNSRDYVGNITYQEALELAKELNGFMLSPSLYVEFLKILKSGKALDGNKKKTKSSRLEKTLKDITEQRAPWRAELLNQRYKLRGGTESPIELVVIYQGFNSSGELIQIEEPLDSDTLRQNKKISLDDWINNPTTQGLPKSNVQDGNLYCWSPKEGRVAGFYAGAGRASLSCNGYPDNSDGDLGVRVAKILKN